MARLAIARGRLTMTEQAGTPTPIAAAAARVMMLARWRSDERALPSIVHIAGAPLTNRAAWIETAFADCSDIRIERAAASEFASDAARPLGTPLSCATADALFGDALDWRAAAQSWGGQCLQHYRAEFVGN
jgi:dTDP-4-dehydrorhamnose reductase